MPPSEKPPIPAQAGPYKRSARNYLLDSKFQLKYTGYIVFVAIVICGVMGAVLFHTTRSVFEESEKVVEQSSKVFQESKKVSEVSRMNVKNLAADDPDMQAIFNKEAEEQDTKDAEQQKEISDNQASILHNQEEVIWALGGGLALMVVAIGLLGIYFTHKVAGPIYKMKRLLGQVGTGSLKVDARLRKGDELQDFFDAFSQMVAGLRTMEKHQLADVDAAIAAMGRGGSDEVKLALDRLREAMMHALEG